MKSKLAENLKNLVEVDRLEIEAEVKIQKDRKLAKKQARQQAKAEAEALALAAAKRDRFLNKWIAVAGVVAGFSILVLGAGWFGLIAFVGVAFILRK